LHHSANGIAVILAVDLLAIETIDIAAVIAACSQDVDHQCDVFFAQSQNDPSEYGAQPLCAAWRVKSSRPVISQQLEQGQRSVMKAWLGLKRQGVLISESRLININSPSDFENFTRAKG
jgi:molybdopterin-guanine dinucleotide biosynthesis protein A